MIEREYILADPGSLFFAKRSVTCPVTARMWSHRIAVLLDRWLAQASRYPK